MTTLAEPAWLAEKREAAQAVYESLPVPSNREEAWRFTNLRGFNPDGFPVESPALELEGDAPSPATFMRLSQAVAEQPALVEPYLGTVVSDGEKFASANAANWRDGVLLHVPAGVEVTTPLRAIVDVTAEGSAAYNRVLIVLERGAKATFVEEYRSAAGAYVNTVVEMIVSDEAQLDYITVQEHSSETRQFGTHRATVGRDAKLDWVAAAVGGNRAKSRMESYLGVNAERRQLARGFGAHVLVDPADRSPVEVWRELRAERNLWGPCVIFECVGAAGLIQRIVESADMGTRIHCAGGWYTGDTLDITTATRQGVTIQFGGGPMPQDWYGTLDAIAAGRLDPMPSVGRDHRSRRGADGTRFGPQVRRTAADHRASECRGDESDTGGSDGMSRGERSEGDAV